MEVEEEIKMIRTILILLSIAIMMLSFGGMFKNAEIRSLKQQINEIKFEQQYIDYVKEDGERQ